MSHEPGYDSHRRKCEAHEALGRVEASAHTYLLQEWSTELLNPLLRPHGHQVLGTL